MSSKTKVRGLAIATAPGGTWVQTDRAAHDRWALVAVQTPRASALLHVLVAALGRNNAVVASHATLAKMARCSVSTLKRSISVLREGNWIEVRQIGLNGTACAYVVNDRVAWSGPRDGIRYSMFSAAIVISDSEQPDKDDIGMQPPLEHIPSTYPGERQMPVGSSEKLGSQPFLDGFGPDLPSTKIASDGET